MSNTTAVKIATNAAVTAKPQVIAVGQNLPWGGLGGGVGVAVPVFQSQNEKLTVGVGAYQNVGRNIPSNRSVGVGFSFKL